MVVWKLLKHVYKMKGNTYCIKYMIKVFIFNVQSIFNLLLQVTTISFFIFVTFNAVFRNNLRKWMILHFFISSQIPSFNFYNSLKTYQRVMQIFLYELYKIEDLYLCSKLQSISKHKLTRTYVHVLPFRNINLVKYFLSVILFSRHCLTMYNPDKYIFIQP